MFRSTCFALGRSSGFALCMSLTIPKNFWVFASLVLFIVGGKILVIVFPREKMSSLSPYFNTISPLFLFIAISGATYDGVPLHTPRYTPVVVMFGFGVSDMCVYLLRVNIYCVCARVCANLFSDFYIGRSRPERPWRRQRSPMCAI